MRSYKSLILSGLLLTGIASNLKSFEYTNYENFEKSNLLAQQEETPKKESRGSGRFAPNNPLSDLVVQAESEKKESRGSGRFAPNNPLSDAAEENLLADVQQQNKENRGSGRLTPNHPQFNSSQEDLMAASKNRRRKVVIIYS